MNKKGYDWKNIIGLLFFAIVLAFLVLLVKNKGDFNGVIQDVMSLFGK